MSMPLPRSPFFAGVRAASAPLLLWALHFALCYVAVAAGCTAIAHGASLTPAALRLALVVAAVLALALGGWLVWRAWRACLAGDGDLLPKARFACALMAWIAIVWTGVPLALLPACSAG